MVLCVGVVGVLGRQQPVNRTTPGVICNGDEQDFSECLRDNSDMCQHATAVKCFLTDQDATQENDCGVNPSTPPPPDPRITTPTGIHTTPSDPTVSVGSSSLPHTDPISADTTATATTTPAIDASTSIILSPPNLYYLIGGLVAVILVVTLLTVAILIAIRFCRNKKQVPETQSEKPESHSSLKIGEPGSPLEQSEPLYQSIDSNIPAVPGNLPAHATQEDYDCSANPAYSAFPDQQECDCAATTPTIPGCAANIAYATIPGCAANTTAYATIPPTAELPGCAANTTAYATIPIPDSNTTAYATIPPTAELTIPITVP